MNRFREGDEVLVLRPRSIGRRCPMLQIMRVIRLMEDDRYLLDPFMSPNPVYAPPERVFGLKEEAAQKALERAEVDAVLAEVEG